VKDESVVARLQRVVDVLGPQCALSLLGRVLELAEADGDTRRALYGDGRCLGDAYLRLARSALPKETSQLIFDNPGESGTAAAERCRASGPGDPREQELELARAWIVRALEPLSPAERYDLLSDLLVTPRGVGS
jgi:hypothetical protein